MSIGKIIDGKAFAASLRERIAQAVPVFVEQAGRKPGLAVVLVGEDPASSVYVRSKGKMTGAIVALDPTTGNTKAKFNLPHLSRFKAHGCARWNIQAKAFALFTLKHQ